MQKQNAKYLKSEIVKKKLRTLYSNQCVWKMMKNIDLQDNQNLLMKYKNANASRTRTEQPPELLYKSRRS